MAVALARPLSFFAQAVPVEPVSADPGLSQNSVHCLLQDRRGFIWVGTHDGLNRFDGYGFEHFKNRQQDTGSISNNTVHALLEDRDGFLWAATDNGLNRYDPRTESFRRFFSDPGQANRLAGKSVHALFEDRAGHLWAGSGTTLHRLDRASGTFEQHTLPIGAPRFADDNRIKAIAQRGDELLIATWGSGIWRFHLQKKTFDRVAHDGDFLPQQHWVEALWSDPSGTFWAILNGFLFRCEAGSERFFLMKDQADLPLKNLLKACTQNTDGRLLLYSPEQGMIRFDPNRREALGGYGLGFGTTADRSLRVSVFLQGNDGAYWIGTQGSGLFRYDPEQNRFQTFATNNTGAEMPVLKDAIGMTQTTSGNILVVSRNTGTVVFNPQTQAFWSVGPHPTLKTEWATCVFEDSRGRRWFGTWGNGVAWFDPKTGAAGQYRVLPGRGDALLDNFVFSITESKDRNLWIATNSGVSVIPVDGTGSGVFKNYRYEAGTAKGLSHYKATVVFGDHAGRMWVGTDGGLNLYHAGQDTFQHFLHNPDDPNTLASNQVLVLFEDSKKRLWVGTSGGGLHRYEPDKQRFLHVTEREGLAHDAVMGIVEDKRGRLWVTTARGLSKYDPDQNECVNYFRQDGLPADQFLARAIALCPNTGKIIAWSSAGPVSFHPDSLHANAFVPPVVIASLKKHTTDGLHTDLIDVPGISALTRLEVPFSENTLTVEFAALNFRRAAKNRYAYQLEGLGHGWTQLGTKRTVTFSDLPPGRYTLRVKGSNNDGIWNEQGATLHLTILPPWYRTWWAYALYALVVGGVAYWLLRKQREAQRLQQRLEREHLEAEQLKALDAAKSRLYTNLSHEFRTPLTAILGMAGRMEQNPDGHLQTGVDIIRRNSQNLLNLVNQLLDLAKLEAGQMPVRLVQGDVVAYLKYVAESFQSLAENKNIALHFHREPDAIVMDYDPDKLRQILSNLLSNAIKFTPEGGAVEVRVNPTPNLPTKVRDRLSPKGEGGLIAGWGEILGKDAMVSDIREFPVPEGQVAGHGEILGKETEVSHSGEAPVPEGKPPSPLGEGLGVGLTVRDTGIGIAPEHLPHIFDRFYQADSSDTRRSEGTGIGLALVQELVRVLQGTIAVESTPGQGTVFTVHLPLTNAAPMEVLVAPSLPVVPFTPAENTTVPVSSPGGERPLLLVVEDNADVRTFLVRFLEAQYRVATAANGQAGIDLALELVPDLVLSDVMMPEKDGFELCDALKNDVRTSHIPVILLTARAEAAARLEGLRRGADAYLSKPFHEEELLLLIAQQLTQRRRLMERYAALQSPEEPPSAHSEHFDTLIEDAFFKQVLEASHARLADADFGGEELARAVFLSLSQLNRKLNALTGKSSVQFLRDLRLHRAQELLRQTDLPVAAVADAVGFNDASYFARVFAREFGATPSEWRVSGD